MKYIKTYESIDIIYDFNIKLEKILKALLKNNRFIFTTINSSKIVLKEIDERVNTIYYNYRNSTFLEIESFHLKDKKMRDIPSEERDKIGVTLSYDFTVLQSQKETCVIMTNFLEKIFTKYSYYKNHRTNYNNNQKNGYINVFIKTSDMPNILNEIENNLEMYLNISKYNI
jgi:hypothetical protein